MPAVAALAAWTRAHPVELRGFAGSADPPRELSVEHRGEAIAIRCTRRRSGRSY
jgi:hypothetical protein